MKTSRLFLIWGAFQYVHVKGAFNQAQEIDYLAKFQAIDQASYAAVDDPSSSVPGGLLSECKSDVMTPTVEVHVTDSSGTILSSSVAAQCGSNTICIIDSTLVIKMDQSLNVGALIIQGSLEWNKATTTINGVAQTIYLCAGYIAVEKNGSFLMDIQQQDQSAWIYIKGNGAKHSELQTRAFGGVAAHDSDENPTIDIQGRKLTRTWSLLSSPLLQGGTKMKLMHNPILMGWNVGDRIAIAPTQVRSEGSGQEFRISAISNSGIITLSDAAQHNFDAEFYSSSHSGGGPVLKSAEVVNLDRSIVITGDDFTQMPCQAGLPEAVAGEQTSAKGCLCSNFRQTCTYGLHTAQIHGGVMRIQNTRVEKCGQRGVAGKYCLHFHHLRECPDCLFENNSIENSHQRGIIVHGTHLSTVEANILYNVRGAGVYIEDGNEMYNQIKYNINICPFPFDDNILHGCTVPGTSNRIADTSDNQSAFYTRAATNDLIGNRAANSFNGMLLFGGSPGRGNSYGKVCAPDARIGRTEGNVFHGHGRFGTYSLGGNYPKVTDQAVDTNGHNVDQSLCNGFDNEGNTRGLPATFKDHLDYHNAFVGHYEAGDIQYNGHNSYDNLNLLYWKETKNFQNGCSAHITDGHYSSGNMALPDMATFIIENTTFGDGVSLEPNHHCNVGITGVLCMPQYVLHNVQWKNSNKGKKWVQFQYHNTQGHNANQHHGGVFTLSPSDADKVMGGNDLEASLFPPGYVSLVSPKFSYLLGAPNNICVLSSSLGGSNGLIYDNGILCKVPLRSLKVYTRNLVSNSAPGLKVESWFNDEGLAGQDTNSVDAWQIIGFHQVGGNAETLKQGYSLPVIPGTSQSYRLSLTGNNPNIPDDWVIEFSDVVIGNRWNKENIYLVLEGRACGTDGLVSSHHDRRFLWSGDAFMENAWGAHGACVATVMQPEDMPNIDCEEGSNDGFLEPTECPSLCQIACGAGSYCDCGTLACHCKAGFTGDDCSVDVCAAARCTNNGICSARYLGFTLPVTSDKACICEDGWSGHLCDLNPCKDVDCSGQGSCIAYGNHGVCKCDAGYSGDHCEISCDNFCMGSYPYRCATSLPDIVKYGCNSGGGCNYLKSGQDYPSGGFCTYKDVESETLCLCTSENDCELVGPCLVDGSCPSPTKMPDGAICNSIPWGVCESGACKSTSNPEVSPTQAPIISPTSAPTVSPISVPTLSPPSAPEVSPTQVPTLSPDLGPTPSPNPAPTEISCDNFCRGSYPYNCQTNLPDIVKYGCNSVGGCNYLKSGQDYPPGGFCTYKDVEIVSPTLSPPSAPEVSPTQVPTLSPDLGPTPSPNPAPTEISCDNFCRGSYPYNCQTNLPDIVKYGCNSVGGCNYLKSGQDYPPGGFCTYKDVETVSPTSAPAPSPTQAPTMAHTSAPALSPTSAPTISPTSSPLALTPSPTPAPTVSPTPAPTVSPTSVPTASPTQAPTMVPTPAPALSPTSAPIPSPTSAPTPSPTSAPIPSPTSAPIPSPTHAPTPSPTLAPITTCLQSSKTKFLLKTKKNKAGITKYVGKSCNWLKKKSPNRAKKICKKATNCNGKFGVVWKVCPETCGSCLSCDQNPNSFALFYLRTKKKSKKEVVKRCSWLGDQSPNFVKKTCQTEQSPSCYGTAREICPKTCSVVTLCGQFEENTNSTIFK